ncbi:MAG TPA: hypothetical protein VLJ15_02680, partial [Gammaproteobacteria bacterium]|nr:hypothetical protein [Gammaproteobacteria bacterium]
MSHTRLSREALQKVADEHLHLNMGKLLKTLAGQDDSLDAARGLLIVAVKNKDFDPLSLPDYLEENYQELISVAAFYDCLQTKIDSSIPDFQMDEKALGVLRGVTHQTLRELVERDFRHADFMSSTATLEGMRVQFETLIKEYEEYVKTRWLAPDPIRDKLFRLIKSVHAAKNYQPEMEVRQAVLIFVAMDILDECRFMDPQSKLYWLCLRVLNIKSPDELLFRHRENLFNHLIGFFNRGLLDRALHSENEIDEIRQMIMKHIVVLERHNKKNEASNLHLVGSVTSTVTKGVVPTLGRYALSRLAVQAVGITGFWTGPAVGTLFVASTYVANRWYGAMNAPESSALSKATLGLYSVLLKKLSKKTGTAIEDLARLVFKTPRDGHKQLCPFMTLGEQETFRKWVNTLLRRDQGLVLQQEKACIRYVYGLGP